MGLVLSFGDDPRIIGRQQETVEIIISSRTYHQILSHSLQLQLKLGRE